MQDMQRTPSPEVVGQVDGPNWKDHKTLEKSNRHLGIGKENTKENIITDIRPAANSIQSADIPEIIMESLIMQ